MARASDPYLGLRFRVECQGIIEAAFSEVSGLSMKIETEDYKEGGVNDYAHKLPKTVSWENLVLKRGLTQSGKLWKWIWDSIDGKYTKQNIGIILIDSQGNDKWSWTVQNAYPIKWTGPDLKAGSADIAIESLELVHTGITNKAKRK